MKQIEERRVELQIELDAQKTAKERNELGQFATPASLAVEIAAATVALLPVDEKIRFLEPALGTGSFFSALHETADESLIQSAVGVELDPVFAKAAEELWLGRGLEVINGDFTDFPVFPTLQERFNLILTNPPYVRHHHLDASTKKRLALVAQSTSGIQVGGLAGLYVYFALLADACMEEGGIAAWLIPSEFMDVNYGEALKKYLLEKVQLLRVHRFDPLEVQFDDALVSSAVVIFRKTKPSAACKPTFSFGGTLEAPAVSAEISYDSLCRERKWTQFPHITEARSDEGPTLGDLFKIQRGIATGANGFFILAREEAKGRDLPDFFLRPVLPSPRLLKSIVIEREPDGHPVIPNQLVLLDCNLPEEDVQAKFPALWEYLEEAQGSGVRDRYLVRKRTPWYRQEHRPPAPFVCTYMGRGVGEKRPFRFIWNKSDAIVTNMYLMLYPIGGMAELLRGHPDAQGRVFDLLNEVTGDSLRGEGRVYGGGLHKIEPAELGRIPATRFLEEFPRLTAGIAHQDELGFGLVS